MHAGDEQPGKSAPSVLIISEVADDLAKLEKSFRKRGFPVASAGNSDAVRTAVQGNPTLVLVDMTLSLKKGLDLLKTFKRRKALMHIPVIVIAALKTEAEVRAAADMGIDEYLVKPLSSGVLFNRVKKVLAGMNIEMPEAAGGS